MAHRVWVTGDQVTLARIQDLEDEGITRCTSTTRPPATSGMTAHETDTGKYIGYNGSAWVEVMRLGAWDSTTWVPVVRQNGSAVTTTVTEARFTAQGKHVVGQCQLLVTGTGSTGVIDITLPVAARAATNPVCVGQGHFFDNGGTKRYLVSCEVDPTSATRFSMIDDFNNTSLGNSAAPGALGAGDMFRLNLSYESV